VFVRIGGDPAELGNWPNLPDFQLPGIWRWADAGTFQDL
jgi:hypothetical protein